jgi:hypothetical protein
MGIPSLVGVTDARARPRLTLLFCGQALARVLDRMLTVVLVMMVGGCVLIAIGVGAQILEYFNNFRA